MNILYKKKKKNGNLQDPFKSRNESETTPIGEGLRLDPTPKTGEVILPITPQTLPHRGADLSSRRQ